MTPSDLGENLLLLFDFASENSAPFENPLEWWVFDKSTFIYCELYLLWDKLRFKWSLNVPAPEYLGMPTPPKPSSSPFLKGGAKSEFFNELFPFYWSN